MSHATFGQPKRDEVRRGELGDLIAEVLDEDAFWNDGRDVDGSVERILALVRGDVITLRRPVDGAPVRLQVEP